MAMMKSLAAACLLLFAHSLSVRAEELPPPIVAVAAILELNNDQIHALLTMIEARDAAIRPLAEELQRHQQALAQQLQSPSPDPATIGQLIIEMRAIESRIQQTVGDANKRLDDILSADQRTRLDQLRAAAGVCPVIPAFKAVGLL